MSEVPRIRGRLLVGTALVAALAVASCGDDEGTATSPTEAATVTAGPPTSPAATVDADAGTSTEPPGHDDASTSVVPSSPVSGPVSSPGTGPVDTGSPEPVCAAFGALMFAGLFASFASFDDPDAFDAIVLGFMPTISSRFDAAVAALPVEGVSDEFEATLREVAVAFGGVADEVRATGITDADVARLGSVLDADTVEQGPGADDVDELIDADVLARLGSVDVDVESALNEVPEPDEDAIVALCPELGGFFGGVDPDVVDACSVVDDLAVGVVFPEGIPPVDPRDEGTGMCVWADDALDRELVVSVTDRATVDSTRDGNAESFDIVDLPELGDGGWVIDGLLAGASSTGGRGGFGSGRATVGAIDGARGLLVAVRAPDGDPVALATEVATIVLGG